MPHGAGAKLIKEAFVFKETFYVQERFQRTFQNFTETVVASKLWHFLTCICFTVVGATFNIYIGIVFIPNTMKKCHLMLS